MLKTHDFYYDLPEELIAQTPLERRDASRLMTLDRKTGEVTHRHFYDLLELLQPGDCLVMNNSRVLPARLLGHRVPTGGAVEVLLLKDQGNGVWECLTKPGRKTHTGTELSFGDGDLTATVVGERDDGNKLVQFHYEGIFLEVLERLGKMPLPPYIKEELQDGERYQTVYSKINGSAAAPTAGLHFTQELLDKLAEAETIYHLLTEGSDTPVLPVTPSKPKNDKPTTGSSFTDVPAGSWYEEAVNYVHEKGLMNGTSSNAFSPDRLRRHNFLPDAGISG